jgi:D-beta-D-heptose 7-phosphate kinase/D-beta-D-heptose 1-phosphate adenosyltransferase
MKSTKDSATALLSILRKFSGIRIAVAGDFMLDHFIWGRASRLSAEAPVPVVESTGETYHPGGAGNVAANLAALAAAVSPFGITGRDRAGKLLRQALRDRGISSESLLAVSGRPTTVKLRIIETGRRHQIARVDTETSAPAPPQLARRLATALLAGRFDAVIVSDYDKGSVTPEFLAAVLPELRRRGTPVFLDPRTRQPELYRPISVLTPNRQEAERITGIEIRDEASLQRAANELLRLTEGTAVLITLSDQGMVLLEASGRMHKIPTVSREVYDVTGAGDTVIAAFALAHAAGASFADAARIANHAAGIAVGHVGTAAPSLEELRETISE